MEDPPEQVEVITHNDDGGLDFFDVATVRLGVVRQGEVHLLLDADVVDDEALLLVLEFPVHPGDGLDQVVALDGLVDVDGVEEGHVKARQPHVDHDGDLEVGFGLLELRVEFLAVVLVAEQVVERLLVVIAPRHHHLDALHGQDLFLLLVRQFHPLGGDAHLGPLGAQLDDLLVKVVGDRATAADKERLTRHGGTFGYALLVVFHEIRCQRFDALRIAEDGAHVGHGLLAVFDGVVTSSGFGAFVVVFLDLLQLAVVEDHLGGAAFVNDGHGDLVCDRFGHGVAVHHLAKDIEGGIDGRAGEADVGRIGQGVVQILGEAKGPLHALVGDLELLVQIHLAAVRFVGNADHVGAIGQQLGVFGELVNGGEKDPATVTTLQEFAQVIAALHADDRLIADVALGISEQARELIIEIRAVGDHDQGRAGEIHALHQQPRQEEHGEALAAAGRAKVGAALAVAFRLPVLEDVPIQLRRGVVLRVAAEDLLLLARGVGQVNEVPDDIQQPRLVKQSLDHGVERIDPVLLDQVAAVRLAPGVVELVGSEEGTRLVVHPVADHAERIKLKQLGDVALVASGQLHVGVVNRRLLADRALEFKDDQGQAVDVENAIGDAFLAAGDLQLVDDLEEVIALTVGCVGGRVLRDDGGLLVRSRFAKGDQPGVVDQLDVEILLGVVFAFQEEAVRDQFHDRLVALVEIGGGVGFELVDDRFDFLRRDTVGGVLLGEEGAEVGLDEHFLRLALNRLAQHVRVALGFEKLDDG